MRKVFFLGKHYILSELQLNNYFNYGWCNSVLRVLRLLHQIRNTI